MDHVGWFRTLVLDGPLDRLNVVELFQKFGELPGGVVLVGGGAKLPGLTDFAKQEMKLTSQIGFSVGEEWEAGGGSFKEFLEDPELVSAFGLVLKLGHAFEKRYRLDRVEHPAEFGHFG